MINSFKAYRFLLQALLTPKGEEENRAGGERLLALPNMAAGSCTACLNPLCCSVVVYYITFTGTAPLCNCLCQAADRAVVCCRLTCLPFAVSKIRGLPSHSNNPQPLEAHPVILHYIYIYRCLGSFVTLFTFAYSLVLGFSTAFCKTAARWLPQAAGNKTTICSRVP